MDAVHIKNRNYILWKQTTTNEMPTQDKINGESINRSTKVKYLRSQLDEELELKQHVQAKCKDTVINLCNIQNIR